jgi:hypothetical protein
MPKATKQITTAAPKRAATSQQAVAEAMAYEEAAVWLVESAERVLADARAGTARARSRDRPHLRTKPVVDLAAWRGVSA